MVYKRLRNILSSAFSHQTDLNPVSAKALYERALVADADLRVEVASALGDPEMNWIEMLSNDEYEVYEASDEADAFCYARRILASDFL